MDTSNPVMNSDRVTVGDALDRLKGRKRQKLEYLRELANRATRVVLPEGELFPLEEVRTIQQQYLASRPQVSPVKGDRLDEKNFEVVAEGMPVCGLKNWDGTPVHPPGVNSSGGHVSVQRKFGNTPRKPEGLLSLIESLGPRVLETTSVYTSGTWEGFSLRLSEQMGRKTSPLQTTCALADGLKKPYSRNVLLDRLDKLMPRRQNLEWPGIHTPLEEALLGGIKITSKSSAGAPYWRHKGECLDEILYTGLPVIVDALKSGRVKDLMRENPELFLVEVKNKLDRYKVEELARKTRPYVCVPAHWAFLFSMLSQGFQDTLDVFDRNPQSCNAYGFSSAGGGLERMVDWMESADKRGKVVCYGDDACIVVRRGKEVFRVDPDFKQMDGSVDAKDISLTIAWILRHVRKDLGEEETPHFWQGVADVWKSMATNPNFIIDGKRIYRKKSPNGLMTGVPGTTLFDTVKSVLAWNSYLDMCEQRRLDPLDGKLATRTMAEWGLIIKPGTWNPAPLPPRVAGNLMTDHKFLGVQILCDEWDGRLVYLPHIPEAEAIEMMVVQKDDPFDQTKSEAVRARTLFDRMRGMMLTFGFVHPRVTEAIHHVVNKIDSAVIIMQVQTGTGERPEHVTMQEFSYPDSSGFPTPDFCKSVYAGGESRDWAPLFHDLDGLDELKLEARQEARSLRLALESRPIHIEATIPQERPLDPVLETAVAFKPSAVPAEPVPFNKRSKITRVSPGKRVEEKFLPPRGESIKLFLDQRGSVSQVGTVLERFKIFPSQLKADAESFGLFYTGLSPCDLVSTYPFATPGATDQPELEETWKEKSNLIDRGAGERKKALHRAAREELHIKTSPEMIMLDLEYLSGLDRASWVRDFPEAPPRWLVDAKDENDALAILNSTLTTSYGGMRWETLPVSPGKPNPVSVRLHVGTPSHSVAVAQAASGSRKMAQVYIARAVLESNGLRLSSDKFTVPYLPPPLDDQEPVQQSWAQQVVELESPYRAPTIQHAWKDRVKPEPPETLVEAMYGNLEGAREIWDVALIRRPQDPLTYVMNFFQHQASGSTSPDSSGSSGVGMSPPESPSKRGKLSQAKRTRLNRKLTLKRREKLASLTASK